MSLNSNLTKKPKHDGKIWLRQETVNLDKKKRKRNKKEA